MNDTASATMQNSGGGISPEWVGGLPQLDPYNEVMSRHED